MAPKNFIFIDNPTDRKLLKIINHQFLNLHNFYHLANIVEYQKPLKVLDIIVHKKYKTKLIKSQRVDFDIALLRLDYPIIDENSGKI